MNVLITEAGGCYTVYTGRGEVLNFDIDTQPSLCRNCIQSFDNASWFQAENQGQTQTVKVANVLPQKDV